MIAEFQTAFLLQNEDKEFPVDSVWTLSIKLIDLNTNLHNPNVKPMLRYSREAFAE